MNQLFEAPEITRYQMKQIIWSVVALFGFTAHAEVVPDVDDFGGQVVWDRCFWDSFYFDADGLAITYIQDDAECTATYIKIANYTGAGLVIAMEEFFNRVAREHTKRWDIDYVAPICPEDSYPWIIPFDHDDDGIADEGCEKWTTLLPPPRVDPPRQLTCIEGDRDWGIFYDTKGGSKEYCTDWSLVDIPSPRTFD